MAVAFDLFESPDLFFAELWCPPDDPEWGEENEVTRHIVALPSAPVWQSHDGAERQLFTQNNVVFHHPGTWYRRERFRDIGYRCLFFFPSAGLVREVASEFDPSAAGSDIVPLPRAGPLAGRTFALSRSVARRLRSAHADPLPARELLYEVLRQTVGACSRERSAGLAASEATRRARREIVEEAKITLTSRMAEPVSLDDLSRTLHTSPYHLARLFRSATGFSVHGYLTHLRLRTGLERIQGHETIGEVGLGVGFSGHSHFTAAFRRAFGLTPSALLASPADSADRGKRAGFR
jgi:AraC family transcriptional regulator